MKLFRRSNSNGKAEEHTILDQRTISPVEGRRRSSLSTLPVRLRRRKTKASIETEDPSRARLGELFLSLPSELQTQVICYLSLPDVFSIRRTSRSFCSILDHNSSVICRHLLSQNLPRQACLQVQTLYPIPPTAYDLSHLLRMLHRQKKIDKMIHNTFKYAHMRLYVINPTMISTDRPRLKEALQAPAWIVYHFLESYRSILLHEHDREHGEVSGRFWNCQACDTSAKALVNSYASDMALAVHAFLQLMMHHYEAATRPPSQPNPLGRHNKMKQSLNEVLSTFALLGGIEEMSKIDMMQGSYAKRIDIIKKFSNKVRAAADLNTANLESSQTSPPNSGRNPTDPSTPAPDVTKSLDPTYSELTSDQLNRLPNLAEFLVPIWRDRIERENLHAEHPDDLHSPFNWVQRIINPPDPEPDLHPASPSPSAPDYTHDDHDLAQTTMAGIQSVNGESNQPQPQSPPQPQPPPQLQPVPPAGVIPTFTQSSNLFASHRPTNLMPIFAAPPV